MLNFFTTVSMSVLLQREPLNVVAIFYISTGHKRKTNKDQLKIWEEMTISGH